jgi:hypothetical protein
METQHLNGSAKTDSDSTGARKDRPQAKAKPPKAEAGSGDQAWPKPTLPGPAPVKKSQG